MSKLLRTKWPRIRAYLVRGKVRFIVDARPEGRREVWRTEAEALASAEAIERQKNNQGALSFAELSSSERRDAAEALALLDGEGTLLDAARTHVRERERQVATAHVPRVSEAIAAYLNAKAAEEAKGEIARVTLNELRSKMGIVERAFGQRNLADIDESAVRDFLRHLPHRAEGKKNIKGKLSQFLNYCRREGKWITANPCEGVKVRVKPHDVRILSVAEVQRLLNAGQSIGGHASAVPYLAVQLFSGLRPFEAFQLRWEQVHFETRQIEVLAATSKTRESRFSEMEEVLIEWLLPHRQPHGPIIGANLFRTMRTVKAAAGLTPWVKDIPRHTFASYWLSVHKDRAALAETMGTSLQMIRSHYKRAIPESVAQSFWRLTPAKPGKIIAITAA